MAHTDQLHFIRSVVDVVITPSHTEIVEFGSYDVNGHIRAQFTKFPSVRYTGIDLIPGPNVDVACDASIYKHPVSIDVAVSCECLEHNPSWRETIINMLSSLGENGVAIISFAAKGRKEHGTSRADPSKSPGTTALGWSYYRNLTAEDFEAAIKDAPGKSSWLIATNLSHFDVYGVVAKGSTVLDTERLIDAFANGKSFRFLTRQKLLVQDRLPARRLKQRIKFLLESVLGGWLYQSCLLWVTRRR